MVFERLDLRIQFRQIRFFNKASNRANFMIQHDQNVQITDQAFDLVANGMLKTQRQCPLLIPKKHHKFSPA